MDARKSPLGAEQALELIRKADHLYAAKGKNVVHYDLRKQKPTDDELLRIVLGPTGNLRAPTLRVGKTVIIGFDPEMYGELLE